MAHLSHDAGHPVSRGYACVKGPAFLEVHRDPGRLARPQRRDGARWHDLDWPTATREIGECLRAIRALNGPHAVAVYIGNPTAFFVGPERVRHRLLGRARRAGALEVEAEHDDALMPGTVSLPHGWGHTANAGWRTAARDGEAGVNVNTLAADGPAALEPISGMARLTGIEVEVAPV